MPVQDPAAPEDLAEHHPAERIEDVMGDLAERHIKKKESGHQEEDPHEAGFRASVNPEPHSSKPDGKKDCHERYGEEIIRTAYDAYFGNRDPAVNPSQSNEERQAHKDHDDLRNCGAHQLGNQGNKEGRSDGQCNSYV